MCSVTRILFSRLVGGCGTLWHPTAHTPCIITAPPLSRLAWQAASCVAAHCCHAPHNFCNRSAQRIRTLCCSTISILGCGVFGVLGPLAGGARGPTSCPAHAPPLRFHPRHWPRRRCCWELTNGANSHRIGWASSSVMTCTVLSFALALFCTCTCLQACRVIASSHAGQQGPRSGPGGAGAAGARCDGTRRIRPLTELL